MIFRDVADNQDLNILQVEETQPVPAVATLGCIQKLLHAH